MTPSADPGHPTELTRWELKIRVKPGAGIPLRSVDRKLTSLTERMAPYIVELSSNATETQHGVGTGSLDTDLVGEEEKKRN
jgi:hypothetical protein